MPKSALSIIVLILLAGSCASIVEQAQEQKAGIKTDEILSELTRRLNLSEEKANLLRPIIRESIILENEVWDEFGSTPLLIGKLEALYAETDEKIEALLTPEQKFEYSRYKRYRAEKLREEVHQYRKMQRQIRDNQQ